MGLSDESALRRGSMQTFRKPMTLWVEGGIQEVFLMRRF